LNWLEKNKNRKPRKRNTLWIKYKSHTHTHARTHARTHTHTHTRTDIKP